MVLFTLLLGTVIIISINLYFSPYKNYELIMERDGISMIFNSSRF